MTQLKILIKIMLKVLSNRKKIDPELLDFYYLENLRL